MLTYERDKMKKYAIVSMDVEDWYHNDYFLDAKDIDHNYHMMDGIDVLDKIMKDNAVHGTFFVLSELLPLIKDQIIRLDKSGNEIACHGLSHNRPITMSTDEFRRQITEGKSKIETTVGHKIIGYRAPTYGIDDDRLKIIRELGFKFDSSKVGLTQNPKYGHLNLSDFSNPIDNIYINKDFCEFEISSQDFAGYKLPIGGGYLRMLPWWFNQMQLKKYAETGKFFVMYIHPFELSSKKVPYVSDAGILNRIRSTLGRRGVSKRVDKVIRFMKSQGYEFVTYKELREKVLSAKIESDFDRYKSFDKVTGIFDMKVSNQPLPIAH